MYMACKLSNNYKLKCLHSLGMKERVDVGMHSKDTQRLDMVKWYMPFIPALRRLRQVVPVEFEVSLEFC